MSDRSPDTKDTQPVATQNGEINPSRRKLTGAALGVSAIFTLASRPVLAGVCNSPSAAASGNLSHHGAAPNCTGNTPAQWVTNNAGKDVTFHTKDNNNNKDGNGVFVSGDRADWGGKSLYQVMGDNGTGNSGKTPNPISKEFAAALLNIRSIPTRIPATVLDEVKLIGMWNEWLSTGGFTPMAGVTPWTADQIVWYLRTLQT